MGEGSGGQGSMVVSRMAGRVTFRCHAGICALFYGVGGRGWSWGRMVGGNAVFCGPQAKLMQESHMDIHGLCNPLVMLKSVA